MKTERTTQADLLRIAERHAANYFIKSMAQSIKVETMMACQEQRSLSAHCEIAKHQLSGEMDYQIAMDQSSLVKVSGELAVRLSVIASNYTHLAIMLERVGEKINY